MFSEKHNGENPEELETVEVCETVENEKPAAEPAETETVETVESAETEEIAQTEVPAEEQLQNEAEAEQKPEEQNSKLQALLGAIKEKLSAVVQKVRMWILQKTQAEEVKVEAVPAETLEEVKVEEIVPEENENESVVEETLPVETVEEPAVEENVETTASEEMAEAEETDTAQPVEADLFAEESEEPAPAKKINPLHLGLMIAGGVILLVLLVFVVLRAAGIDLKPRENNILYKDSYAAEDEKLEKNADTVIATIGDKELTISELQLYYINSIYSFYSQNYYYMDYMGLDLTKPLSEQVCALDETMTWEQYFLDGTVKSWQSYALVELMAEQDGFIVPAEIQQQIDSMGEQLESIAVAYGYEDAEAYLSTEMAPGISSETYLHFNEVYHVTNEYLSRFYEEDYPTDAEIMIFHAQNRETFEANGITPDMGLVSNVRHILIQPMGGTVSEDGLETVYSEDEWATALSEAERILEAWKSGEATEESFAAMANTYSADGGSNTTGGLYEAIDPFSSYVPEFLNWAVDMSRQPGDTEIVKTTYGYHIMYFVSGEDYFNYVVGEQLVAERIQTKLTQMKEDYPIDVNYKKIVLCEPAF